MSFLDEFEFTFQDLKLILKITEVGKYGEEIKTGETETSFKGVIQEIKDFSKYFLDNNKNFGFTSKDYELRNNNEIKPKKGDIVEDSFGNSYEVVFVEIQSINGLEDHIRSVVRINN